MQKRWFSLWAVLLLSSAIALTSVGPLYAAPAQRDCTGASVYISSPTSGSTVSGSLQIIGSASLPANQFRYYKVEYSTAGANAWVAIVDGVRNPVLNGTLATVNTLLLPEGDYALRLHVVDPTGNYCEAITSPIHVSHTVETPTATPTFGPTQVPHVIGTVAPGTPTLVVDLNSNVPGSDSVLTGAGNATKSLLPQLPFDVNSLGSSVTGAFGDAQHSFIWGIQLTAGLFILLGVVVFLRQNL